METYTPGLSWVRLGSEAATLDRLTAHPLWTKSESIMGSQADVRSAIADQGITVEPRSIDGLGAVFDEAADTWGLAIDVRLHLVPRPEYNAFVLANPLDGTLVLGASCSLAEHFDARELAFVLGHELGHHDLGHTVFAGPRKRLTGLVPPGHPLRLLDASLGRRHEISADRAGLLLCGSLAAAQSALLKAATQTPNHRLGADALRGAIGVGEDYPFVDPELDGVAPWDRSHPPARLRLRALEAFAEHIGRNRGSRDLADVDARCDAWLDAMEHDSLKHDRALVDRFRLAVAAVVGTVATRLRVSAGFAAHAAAWLGADTDEASFAAACETLRSLGSPGRRLRVLAAATSVASAEMRLDAEAEALLRSLAESLGLPATAAGNHLGAARQALAALTATRTEEPR